MQNPIVHNQYDPQGSLGGADPSTQTQAEMSIYDYAIAHEHEHITSNGHWTHCDEVNKTMVELANDAHEEIELLQSQNNGGTVAQNALSIIQDNFKEELADFSEVKILGKLDSQFQNAISYDKANEQYFTSHWSWGACGETTIEHTHLSMADGINHAEQSMQNIKPLLHQVEKNIESFDPSQKLSDFFASLNGFVGNSSSQNSDVTFLDSKDETQAINTLLEMIKEQIEVDAGLQENKDGEIKELSVHEMLILEANQSTVLDNLSISLENAFLAANKELGNEKIAINSQNALKLFVGSFGYNHSNQKLDNEELLKQATEHLSQAIYAAQNDLTQVSADVANNAFQSLMISINEIMAEVEKVLSNPKLSAKAKEEKLAQLLQLMLGFLQMFIQIAQNLRSENKQKMEKATIVAQKTNIQNIQTDSQVFQEIEAQEKSLKILHTVMEWVEIVSTIAFIVTGTIGVALAMTTMLILDKTKVTQKWTNDLSNDEHSKAGGSATMAGIALAATLLGGVGIDLLAGQMKAVAKVAIDTAEKNAADTIHEAIAQVAEDAASEERASSLINDAVKVAKELAAKNAAKQFYKNLPVLSALKSAMTVLSGRTDVKLEAFITKAVETAIRQAVKEQADAIATGQVLPAEEIQESFQGVSTKAVDGVLKDADTAATSPTSWAETAKSAYNKLIEASPKALRSGLWAGAYTAADTNFLVNCLPETQNSSKKTGKMLKKTVFQIIQMLMEMSAVLKGGGFLSQMASNDRSVVVNAMQRSSALMQVGSLGVSSGSDFVQYGIDKKQAEATANFQEAQAYNTMLREISNQDHASADPTAAGLSIEEKKLAEQQLWLSSHMWDGMNAASRVLAAQSV